MRHDGGLERRDVRVRGPRAGVSAPALRQPTGPNTPTLAFSNASDHGYAIVEARADALDVTFRAVETIQRPTAAVRDLARFSVAARKVGPQPV